MKFMFSLYFKRHLQAYDVYQNNHNNPLIMEEEFLLNEIIASAQELSQGKILFSGFAQHIEKRKQIFMAAYFKALEEADLNKLPGTLKFFDHTLLAINDIIYNIFSKVNDFMNKKNSITTEEIEFFESFKKTILNLRKYDLKSENNELSRTLIRILIFDEMFDSVENLTFVMYGLYTLYYLGSTIEEEKERLLCQNYCVNFSNVG